MRINDPETIAELQALYPRYETALVTNDAETLTGMFWASPHVTRFGITENLHGIGEIAAFRMGGLPASLDAFCVNVEPTLSPEIIILHRSPGCEGTQIVR